MYKITVKRGTVELESQTPTEREAIKRGVDWVKQCRRDRIGAASYAVTLEDRVISAYGYEIGEFAKPPTI